MQFQQFGGGTETLDSLIDAVKEEMEGVKPGPKAGNLFEFLRRANWLREYTAKVPNTLDETRVFVYTPYDGRPAFEVEVPSEVQIGSYISFSCPNLPEHE